MKNLHLDLKISLTPSKILKSNYLLLALGLFVCLIAVPQFSFAEVFIPSHEYVSYFDSNGIYTVIGNVKNDLDYAIIPTITVSIENNSQIFLASGYVFDIDEDFKFKPSTLIKMSSGAPVEFDINANVWYKNIFGVGAALRTGDAYVGMAEVQVTKQLRIGYAYDYTISALKTIAGSSNEVMLRYEFGKESKNVKSTRYF